MRSTRAGSISTFSSRRTMRAFSTHTTSSRRSVRADLTCTRSVRWTTWSGTHTRSITVLGGVVITRLGRERPSSMSTSTSVACAAAQQRTARAAEYAQRVMAFIKISSFFK